MTPIAEIVPFSEVRLVAADLDGTLLDSSGTLWSAIRSLVLQVSRLGVIFTIATGRTLSGVRPTLVRLGIKRVPLVLYNGSIALASTGTIPIRRATIPARALDQVLAIALDHGATVLAYYWRDEKSMLFRSPIRARKVQNYSDTSDSECVLGWTPATPPYVADSNGQSVEWQRTGTFVDDTEPSAVLVDIGAIGIIMGRQLSTHVTGIVGASLTSSGSRFLELRPTGSNKWSGIEKIAASYGIEKKQILAIGDNDNDIEMLREAGIGVAVANASQALLASADFACAYSSASGAQQALQLIRTARRLSHGLSPFGGRNR